MHPVIETKHSIPKEGLAWAHENKAVLGLIEVKRDHTKLESDVDFLSKVLDLPLVREMRALEWVLLVAFFSGYTLKEVKDKTEKISTNKLVLIPGDSSPKSVEIHRGSEGKIPRWFDVMCYGRNVERP